MYKVDEEPIPFWAEFSSVAGGRDPLAIQNSSVVIYSQMVVGITNVTNRIRYNGFFCWIIDTIAVKIKKRNSLQEQIRYLRRAELLLAYVMVKNFPEVTGVSGSTYASNNMDTIIDLSKGADWEFKQKGEKVYWQNPQGVFGQYYSGVTRVLNLINHPSPHQELNIYTLTENGRKLAEVFKENISEKECSLFWQSVYNGVANESDLINLKSFALHMIEEGSKEHAFYEKIIVNADDRKIDPTFNRRDTISLLLNYLSENKEGVEYPVNSFLRDNYYKYKSVTKLQYNAAAAWYLFEINEIIHVAYEHFHACFLYYIDEQPTLIEKKLNNLVIETLVAFYETDDLKGINSIYQLIDYFKENNEDIYESYNNMAESFRFGDYGESLMHAVKTIIQLYVNTSHQIEQLKAFAEAPEFNFNRPGYAIELFDDLVVYQMGLDIEKYVKVILLKAINAHTFSSYRKTKIGQSMVHNYMIENQFVWRLRETIPNRTSPRLQNVLQYIMDIGWIKNNKGVFNITNNGIEILERETT